ncbi:MAG: IMP cyclohydrolase [Deltaproteobacteria bacterium]|nr:IMP cyclohydrolase [Deltaproteobacteria bacterium]
MEDLKKAYRTIMDDHFPETMTITFDGQTLIYHKQTWRIKDDDSGEVIEKGLRYGENPGQEAALYRLANGNLVLSDCAFINPGNGLVSAVNEEDMLQFGKHPGKTNLTDADNAMNILKFLMNKPTVVIVKHNNPCGVATADDLATAYARANMADRIAAFGGCAAFNRPVDKATAALIKDNYLEVVVAPDYEEGALSLLKSRPNLRIIKVAAMDRLTDFRAIRYVDFKSLIDGGIIVQQSPVNRVRSKDDLTLASGTYQGQVHTIKRLPTEQEYADLLFGWYVEQGVTSNSVIYVKNGVTVGVGTGEQDRVGVAELAVYKAYVKYADAICFSRYALSYKELEAETLLGKRPLDQKEEIDAQTRQDKGGLIGAAMVSDAFFPFRDGVEVGIRQGVTAVIQPGGSMRDFEVIDACNEAEPSVTMVYTGQRAFKH